MSAKTERRVRLGRWLVGLYLLALLASHGWQAFDDPPDADADLDGRDDLHAVEVPVPDASPPRTARLAYRDLGSSDEGAAPVVLIHGSPGRKENFDPLAPAIAEHVRVLLPDLPGFGQSDLDVPDYSIRAHGDYLLSWLDALDVERAHLVGYSMGGGPALHAWQRAPERVASLTLLSSIGVQEMELLGRYDLNHALHGLQLGLFWLLREGLPHFGTTDVLHRATTYARNFYDSDQRPLRGLLERFEPPLLVVHGRNDFLVPMAAAEEHHRIVAHSEAWWTDEGHFMVFREHPRLVETIVDFVRRVEAGEAPRRDDATAARRARAAEPFDPASVPPATGVWLGVLVVLLALATLVSEDLTCIAAGLMAAQGQISFLAAAGACLAGIFVGDILLFLAGRWLGRPATRRAPLRWMISPAAIERSSQWFARRGAAVILASRFLPGTRLPTYFTAGVLRTSFLHFCGWFLVAAVVWTPALVAIAMVAGASMLTAFDWLEDHTLLGLAILAGVLLLLVKVLVPLASHRGRRLLYGSWRRKVRWEFWPPWVFYPPVVAYVAWLALKHRSLAVVTTVNPAIPAGGFIGESKADILGRLEEGVPATKLLPGDATLDERVAIVADFVEDADGSWPVILKPDAGQRGAGVAQVASLDEARDYLAGTSVDTLVQRHVGGVEFGVFYVRHPDDERGRVFSITEKRMPVVVGDGRRTLEQLILDDPRAVAMARVYLDRNATRLQDVPEAGRSIQLTELGTHCRGAIFLDGAEHRTDALEESIDRISRGFRGFHFGRYDIRVPSAEALRRGEDISVIELNGLTSEATHIYDPKYGLFEAYRVLFAQWRLAFAIGVANRRRGVQPTRLRELVRALFGYVREAPDRPST